MLIDAVNRVLLVCERNRTWVILIVKWNIVDDITANEYWLLQL